MPAVAQMRVFPIYGLTLLRHQCITTAGSAPLLFALRALSAETPPHPPRRPEITG
jgi:hypothetical protein